MAQSRLTGTSTARENPMATAHTTRASARLFWARGSAVRGRIWKARMGYLCMPRM